jgi:flagellar biosynthesis/type III secretory pathway protein FliH
MSSSARQGRIIRGAPDEGEVFVLGRSVRRELATQSAVADALSLLAAAQDRGRAIAAEADAEVVAAGAEAAAIRQAAYQEGLEAGRVAGREAAAAEMAGYVEMLRKAAAQGKAVRDDIAEESTAVIARAAMLVARRIIGAHYEADPAATAAACADAIRAAAGQTIVSIRVNPSVADDVRAALVEHAGYVKPDAGLAIGGCVIDLRDGTIDASLDARLDLMELALGRAAGEPMQ